MALMARRSETAASRALPDVWRVGEATKVASLCSFAKQPLSLKPRPARAEMCFFFSVPEDRSPEGVRGAIRHAGVSREVPRMA